MLDRPAPLRTDGTNAFAHHSVKVRVPAIIDETIARNSDYPSSIKDALRRLRDEMARDAPLRLFEPPAADFDLWAARFRGHADETWLGTAWFFAEMLSYRRLVAATRFETTRRDPFAPFKREEEASEALWTMVEEALASGGPLEERLIAQLKRMLWGNRIDLSLASVAEKGTDAEEGHLLADDSAGAATILLDASGPVHIILDNAGTEEAMDLVFADLLLSEGLVPRVFLHVKWLPVLVSDVTTADVHRLLSELERRGASDFTRRLRAYMNDGRMRLVADPFWNTDGRLWELPPRLRRPFEDAALVIGKGDVNYRRATNDALWPLETRLRQAVGAFPAPLLLLRTLKSDALVEVRPGRAAELDAIEPDWRTNGTYGVVQCTLKA